jgi:hypothetical protein
MIRKVREGGPAYLSTSTLVFPLAGRGTDERCLPFYSDIRTGVPQIEDEAYQLPGTTGSAEETKRDHAACMV